MKDLEKRAEEYLKAKWGTNKMPILGGDARKVLADFAQSETALLSQHILDLQKDKGKLTDRVRELEAQIEKMKLCANCKHCGVSGWCNKLNRYLLDKVNQRCGNWEIKD